MTVIVLLQIIIITVLLKIKPNFLGKKCIVNYNQQAFEQTLNIKKYFGTTKKKYC